MPGSKRPTGHERLALWREVGQWWAGEPTREIVRYLDAKGVRREKCRELPYVYLPVGDQNPLSTSVEGAGGGETSNTCVSQANHRSGEGSRERQNGQPQAESGVSTSSLTPRTEGLNCPHPGSAGLPPTGEERPSSLPPSHSDFKCPSPSTPSPLKKERGRPEEPHNEEWSLRVRREKDEKMRLAYLSYNPHLPPEHRTEKGTTDHPYVPAHTLSGFAYGRGIMLPEEMARYAASVGLPGIGIADPFSLTGAVELSKACRKVGIRPLIGASFELDTGGEIVLIAATKSGYRQLSQLITACHLEEPRQYPLATWERLARFTGDLICLTGGTLGPVGLPLIRNEPGEASETLHRLLDLYGCARTFIEIERAYLPWEISVNRRLIELGKAKGIQCIAGGPVQFARREHFPAQDILACANTLCQVDEVLGRKLERHPDQLPDLGIPGRELNAERFLRTGEEMAELFRDLPELPKNTLQLLELCDSDVLPERTKLPRLFDEPEHALKELVWAGAHLRHQKITPKLKSRIDSELNRIARLDFSNHFLIGWDACRWASDQQILFSGRGSVVDSAVAYCLGLSRIDAFRHRLHFDRFLPEDGSKRPDIDIDFEAHRRDDVRNYMTRKYGDKHVATVAAIGTYCTRGIVRQVGKAFGIPDPVISFVSKRLHGGVSPEKLEAALQSRPELRGSAIPKERFQWVFALAERLRDVPINIRSHSSGVLVSASPLAETVPVMWSAAVDDENTHLRIVQWDKRSCKPYFDKFDILCLRGQDVLSGAQERIRVTLNPTQNPLSTCGEGAGGGADTLSTSWGGSPRRSRGRGGETPLAPFRGRGGATARRGGGAGVQKDFSVEHIPLDDPNTYAAMRSGELIGIPQSASPAMRQAHVRLRTHDLHEASLVQAGIRPGVGGAVKLNEMIARRHGKPYTFSHPLFEDVLGCTYGIIVFQEQVDRLLQLFVGCTSGEAEEIREAIHEKRREDYGESRRNEIIRRILAQGFSEGIAIEAFDLISNFKGYGFAQGHALAFAEISIRSVYCQQNYPAEYFASLLDAQPAGYYGPCTLVNEARSRGVAILPVDVNRSTDRFEVEDIASKMDPKVVLPSAGIRISLRQIAGVSNRVKDAILSLSDREVRFRSVYDFAAKVKPDRDELEALILCGGLDSLHPNRRALLWAIPSMLDFAHATRSDWSLPFDDPEPEIPTDISDFNEVEKAFHERRLLDLDVERHLMAFERSRIAERGGISSAEARRLPDKRKAIVVGNPIRLRFPPTPSGKRVVFFDLEDETGLLNVTLFDAVYQQDGHAVVCSPYVTVIGESQDRGGHIAFLAKRVFPYRPVAVKYLGSDDAPPMGDPDSGWGKAPLPILTGDFLMK